MVEQQDDYTCTNVSGKWWEFKCSICGYEADASPDDLCNCCPCCGATIVEVDE